MKKGKSKVVQISGTYISEDLYKRSKILVGHVYKDSGGYVVSPGTVLKDEQNGVYYVKVDSRVNIENSIILPDINVGSFQDMINTQGKVFEMYSSRKEYDIPNEYHILNTLMSLIEEVVEVKNVLGLKPWKNKKNVDRKVVLEEIADLTHFYLQLLYLLGIDFKTLYKEYMKKVLKNILRQVAAEEYSTPESIEEGIKLLEELLSSGNIVSSPKFEKDLSSFITRLEKEVGIEISNTKASEIERQILLDILDRITQKKGEYIVKKYGKEEKHEVDSN